MKKITLSGLIKKIKSIKGATLVELIVSFALVSLFMIAATQALTSYMRVYSRINSYINQQQIASILLERTGGIVSKASRAFGDEQTVIISADASEITVHHSDGVLINISVDPDTKHLVLDYSAAVSEENVSIPQTFTGYGSGFYMGNEISELSFVSEGDGIIRISVTLHNIKTDSEFICVKVVNTGVEVFTETE